MLDSPIPQISISLAPEEAIIPEPKSPLAGWAKAADDDDAFRSKHLTPPPTVSPRVFQKVSSPLRPDQPGQEAGRGLEKERFEAMLRSARERGGVGAKKSDLRKEVALKVHQSKQVERRALFLSKVMAPPSPRSTSLPKTPPESPAIFHYTLPSPGLVSPLALFESLEKEARACGPNVPKRRSWVEQVDFRRRDDHIIRKEQVKEPVPSSYHVKQHTMPSLDEISKRIKSQRKESPMQHMPIIVVQSENEPAPRQASHRLPAFLQRRASNTPNLESTPTSNNVPDSRPRAPFSRLNMPVRTASLNAPIQVPQPKAVTPPRSPLLSPKIDVTTIVVPRTSSSSPTKLSESNVQALATRERSSKNMITTLRRRSITPGAAYTTESVPEPPKRINEDAWKGSKWKRHSAPAELQARPRIEFHHPVLTMRGGF